MYLLLKYFFNENTNVLILFLLILLLLIVRDSVSCYGMRIPKVIYILGHVTNS